MIAIKRVRTRDNRLVRFDRRKILAAILEAMSSAGAHPGAAELSEELTDAVTHFLDRSHQEELEVEHIHDMIEKALMETGHRDVARAYILLRERRARGRESIRVRPRDASSMEAALIVEGRHGSGGAPWDRHRITRALIEEGDFDGDTAAEITEVVERRVLRSGLKSISTALIRELVDNELFERGFTKSLKRQASVAVPKYDLEQLLFHGGERASVFRPGNPRHATQLLGDLILRQYVLDEVYTENVKRAHRQGRIHLHQLDHAMQLLRVSVTADRLVSNAADAAVPSLRMGEPPVSFFLALFRAARRVAPTVSEEIEVCDVGVGLHRHRRRQRRGSEPGAGDPRHTAGEFVRALAEHREACAAAASPTPRVRLRFPFMPRFVEEDGDDLFASSTLRAETSHFLVEVLRHALADREGAGLLKECALLFEVSAQTFEDRRFRGTLEAVLRALPREAPVGFFVAGEGADCADSHSATADVQWVTIAGKVTINLPRVAWRARKIEGGAGATESAGSAMESELRDAVGLALDAVRQRQNFVERVALHPDGPFAELQRSGVSDGVPALGSGSHAVGIIGLDDAVRLQCGESMHESEHARELGTVWIDGVQAALRAGSEGGVIPVYMEETPNRGPLRRFEALDAERYLHGTTQSHEASTTASDPGPDRHYCSGVRLRRWAPVDPLQAWVMLEQLRHKVQLSSRLDDTTHLRDEGAEVLLAFLEEICHLRRRVAAQSRDRLSGDHRPRDHRPADLRGHPTVPISEQGDRNRELGDRLSSKGNVVNLTQSRRMAFRRDSNEADSSARDSGPSSLERPDRNSGDRFS